MKYVRSIILMVMVIMISCMVIVTTGNIARAAVFGRCDNCHTMHDSQGNSPMAVGGPLDSLLRDSCIGCHTNTVDSDPLHDTLHTPYVKGTGFTNDNCLAGGFFTDLGGDHDDNSHTIGATVDPAGYSGSFFEAGVGGSGTFSCAGATGCHGNETSVNNDMEAIAGGHHNTGETYRMLYVGGKGPAFKVDGLGDPNYEEGLIAGATTSTATNTFDHNIYSAGATTNFTISELCGKCHGDFHSDTGAPSPYTRHPTDVAIPLDWEIVDGVTGKPHATYYTDADRKYNPLGFVDGASEDNVGYATCLSCHRAHGSSQPDILRFAYDSQQAGTSTADYGCLGCHSKQR